MAGSTNYIGLNTYQQGDEGWTHSEDMISLDTKVIKAGTKTDRPNSAPDQAWYFATDEDIFYQYDSGASSWVERGGLGSSSTPLTEAYYDQLTITNAPTGGSNEVVRQVDLEGTNVESFATAGASGTVPVSQGDGTVQMEDISTSGLVEDLSTDGAAGTAAISDGSGNLTMQDVIQPSEDVETLSTSGASGTAPVSDGAGGLTMTDVAEPSDNVEQFSTAGASGTVPTSDGAGNLTMEEVNTAQNVEELGTTAALNEGFVGDGSGNVVLQSMNIETLSVATESDLPDPSNVTQPTIAYVDGQDDYVATFDSTTESLTNEQLDRKAQMVARMI